MNINWETLDESSQIALARAAMDRAIRIIAARAEAVATEMEGGLIADQGGPDALRLLASLTRCAHPTIDSVYSRISHGQVGHS